MTINLLDPDFVLSADDTGLHAINSMKLSDNEKVMIVSKGTVESKSKHLPCDGCKKKSKSLGVSIKLAIMRAAGGLSAPIIVVVTGLDFAEL